MKGKKLMSKEVLELKEGAKVFCVYNGDRESWVCDLKLECIEVVSSGKFTGNSDDCTIGYMANFIEEGLAEVYEWIEEPIKNERRDNIMKNAVVKFTGTSKQYHFMTDLDLQTGDTVVCDTTVGITVATVIRLEEEVSPLATKWIIDKVDMAAHTKRMELEAKKKDLKTKMEKRRKKLEDIAVFAMLAKEDPDMAELLKEYQEINN